MGVEAEGLRYFWLRNIHQLTGNPGCSFCEWLRRGEFLVEDVTSSGEFTIRVLNPEGLLKSVASDACRLAAAFYETIVGLSSVVGLPRATAWMVIQSYYAA